MIDEKRCKELGGRWTARGCMPNSPEAGFKIYKAGVVEETKAVTTGIDRPDKIIAAEIEVYKKALKNDFRLNVVPYDQRDLQKIEWLVSVLHNAQKLAASEYMVESVHDYTEAQRREADKVESRAFQQLQKRYPEDF